MTKTHDGAAVLSRVTGLSRAEIEAKFEQVKVNVERLRACPLHDFQLIEPAQPLRYRYRCIACRGEIDHSAYRWYTRGIEDARKRSPG